MQYANLIRKLTYELATHAGTFTRDNRNPSLKNKASNSFPEYGISITVKGYVNNGVDFSLASMCVVDNKPINALGEDAILIAEHFHSMKIFNNLQEAFNYSGLDSKYLFALQTIAAIIKDIGPRESSIASFNYQEHRGINFIMQLDKEFVILQFKE